MNKIICNSIEFVFIAEIDIMTPEKVILKLGYDWRKLVVTEKPTFNSEISQATPGPVKEESVTAKTKYDPEALLKQFSNYPVLLRMKTDKTTFFVGSQQYPVITEITNDKIYDSYSFKCKSEV